MPGFHPPQDFVFFADESGISKERFTVVGGICVPRGVIAAVHATILEYRNTHNMKAELKWSKISTGKLNEYERLVEIFFALNSTNQAHFYAIVFDSHQWSHKRYNNGDADVGLSKLYYQVALQKFIRYCGRAGTCAICVDHRYSSTSLHDLRRMLNAAAKRDLGMDHEPLKQLVSNDSKADDILQINDIVLGAVCAVRNGRHLLADSSPAKRRIANLVLEKSGLGTFEKDSPANINRFTIWNMRPRPR